MSFLRDAARSLTTSGGHASCDGVRAIAMLWVCFFHAACHQLYGGGATGKLLFATWWPVAPCMSGDAGVDLFFVLSGFLLGTTLYKDIASRPQDVEGGQLEPRAVTLPAKAWLLFYGRRWFRISPGYISAIALATILNWPSDSRDACLGWGWWSNMLFVNNYYPTLSIFTKNCLLQSWSIAVEVQLYAMLPPFFALAAGISRCTKSTPALAVMSLCAVSWLLCVFLRFHFLLFSVDGVGKTSCPYISTLYRSSTFVAGVAASMAVQHWTRKPQSVRSCMMSSAVLCFSAFSYAVITAVIIFGAEPMYFVANSSWGPWHAKHHPVLVMLHAALGRPIFGAAVAFLLFLSVTEQAPRLGKFLSARCWRPLAGLSYSVYLLQYIGYHVLYFPMSWGIEGSPSWSPLLKLYVGCSLCLLGTLPVALANYVFCERPGMLAGRVLMTRCARKSSAAIPCVDLTAVRKEGAHLPKDDTSEIVGKDDGESACKQTVDDVATEEA